MRRAGVRKIRSRSEVQFRNLQNEKQCGRCLDWLPESCFSVAEIFSDNLQVRCKRCVADSSNRLSVARRRELLVLQNGQCAAGCGCVFDVHGGRGSSYEIDHDHSCCSGKSCGSCIRGLLCHGCNVRDGLSLPTPLKPYTCAMHRRQTYHSDIGMSSDDRDRKVVELRDLGRSYREIGAVTGLSANGVMHALRRISEGRPGRVRS